MTHWIIRVMLSGIGGAIVGVGIVWPFHPRGGGPDTPTGLWYVAVLPTAAIIGFVGGILIIIAATVVGVRLARRRSGSA